MWLEKVVHGGISVHQNAINAIQSFNFKEHFGDFVKGRFVVVQ